MSHFWKPLSDYLTFPAGVPAEAIRFPLTESAIPRTPPCRAVRLLYRLQFGVEGQRGRKSEFYPEALINNGALIRCLIGWMN